MEKFLQTFRYLARTLTDPIVIGFLVILATVATSDLVYFLTDYAYNTVHPVVTLTGPFELTAGIFALLIGLVLIITTFKVTLANGISRKTFLLANLPAAGLAAAAFSIFNLVVVKVHGLFLPIQMISEQIYPQIPWTGLLLFQFALYFLFITAGWFIALAMYRSSTPVKWAIALAPVVVFSLLQVVDARLSGAIFEAFWNFVRWSLDLSRAVLCLLAYSAIVFGLVYLLLHRAPLKD